MAIRRARGRHEDDEQVCPHEAVSSAEGPADVLPGGEVVVYTCHKCKATVVDHEALIRLRVNLHNAQDEVAALTRQHAEMRAMLADARSGEKAEG